MQKNIPSRRDIFLLLLSHMKHSILKTIVTIFGAVFILVLVNFGYFWDNVKFIFTKPIDQQTEQREIKSVPEKMEPNKLIIPRLNLDLPIVYASEDSEGEFQKDLQSGVVHFPDTANPGEPGNVYIFGHSSDYIWSKGNYKHAFSLLPQIKIGDSIVISNQAGDKFIYIVTETKIVSPKDKSVLGQFDYKQKLLTLQTSYPLGTALKRFIVISKLNQ